MNLKPLSDYFFVRIVELLLPSSRIQHASSTVLPECDCMYPWECLSQLLREVSFPCLWTHRVSQDTWKGEAIVPECGSGILQIADAWQFCVLRLVVILRCQDVHSRRPLCSQETAWLERMKKALARQTETPKDAQQEVEADVLPLAPSHQEWPENVREFCCCVNARGGCFSVHAKE